MSISTEVGKRVLALPDQLVSGYPMESWDCPNNGQTVAVQAGLNPSTSKRHWKPPKRPIP